MLLIKKHIAIVFLPVFVNSVSLTLLVGFRLTEVVQNIEVPLLHPRYDCMDEMVSYISQET